MARNKPVYVYPHDCTDFSTTGLVGDLKPLSCEFTEEKNGISEVIIKMPHDQYKKYKAILNDAVIKCEVPVRVPPVINDDEYATSVKVFNS